MGARSFVRIPDAWNGKLVACGTPAMRSEHANDLIFGETLLAAGYAYACSNKGIPTNARIEPGPAAGPLAYTVPFNLGEAPPGTLSMRFGALEPAVLSLTDWHEDFADLIRFATATVLEATGRRPARTYAIGLSMGGGQVRYLLERYPELVDGAFEWAAVHWTPRHAFVRYLPHFLRAMPAYASSGYRDRDVHDAIVAAGFPPDRIGDGPVASLWDAHYGKMPPFYADLTTFVFASLLDPAGPPLATLADRAAYIPTATAERAIAAVEQTGKIGRPLFGVAGDADVFITPQQNFDPYLEAVREAGRGDAYWQFEVAGGTHVDAFVPLGWNLQAQQPFALRAFDLLVGLVERGERPPGAGTKRRVATPSDM